MRALDFRPVLAAGHGDGEEKGELEVQTTQWFKRPPGKTNAQVREFCEGLAGKYGLRLVAIDMVRGDALSAAFGRFDRLWVTPAGVREAIDAFAGEGTR